MQKGEEAKDFQAIYVNSATATLTFDAKINAVQLLSAENEDFNNFADEFDNNITASVSYLGAYRDNYREHTGMLNVKYAF